ncbi:MAG: ECF-type sigma factor [Aestuariibacter sp.]
MASIYSTDCAMLTEALNTCLPDSACNNNDMFMGLYQELKRIANGQLVGNSLAYTLSPTSLVHEAYLRLNNSSRCNHWGSKGQFLQVAASAVRCIIIDYARRKSAQKRAADHTQPDNVSGHYIDEQVSLLLHLEQVLNRLDGQQQDVAKVIELRFFIGLSTSDIAEAMESSVRTVQRLLNQAKCHLRQSLEAA